MQLVHWCSNTSTVSWIFFVRPQQITSLQLGDSLLGGIAAMTIQDVWLGALTRWNSRSFLNCPRRFSQLRNQLYVLILCSARSLLQLVNQYWVSHDRAISFWQMALLCILHWAGESHSLFTLRFGLRIIWCTHGFVYGHMPALFPWYLSKRPSLVNTWFLF